ncbi:radical SAM/SPASM domain-containing protein [Embleya sp. MST-111070]|uniref:radical SAM/SPASM domain-containing protein n=1 Tax=Embleya sp. MST-111070 TaxID=3398231 RepID=UPI003F73ED97
MTTAFKIPARTAGLDSLELEVTGGCQLACTHCLSSSSPKGTHGVMTLDDWRAVIIDAAGIGVSRIQLIGGEPTLYPAWDALVDLSLSLGLRVEVYSNLYKVLPATWETFERPGVSVATSYYSDTPAEHDSITTKPGSYHRTRSNISEVIRRGIRLRAGIIRVSDTQRVTEARAELVALGVDPKRIGIDRVRAVGRAAPLGITPSTDELCGRCGTDRAAVLPSGQLVLCVLSRFMPVENVRVHPLSEIVMGPAWQAARDRVPALSPTACQPDGNDCEPSRTESCTPSYDDIPDE